MERGLKDVKNMNLCFLLFRSVNEDPRDPLHTRQ